MSKAARTPGSPIQQFQGAGMTLASTPKTMTEKRAAQLVVCQYVDAWSKDLGLDEAGKIAEVNELLDILGISGR